MKEGQSFNVITRNETATVAYACSYPCVLTLRLRPLQELLKSKEMFKGAESQRLRIFATSQCMEPSRDVQDSLGSALLIGDLAQVKQDFESRRQIHELSVSRGDPSKLSIHYTAIELDKLRWGPTHVPIYCVLLLATLLVPEKRSQHLEIARFLVSNGVPVDGGDISGTTVLAHAISTKPHLDLEFAEIVYGAGGDVNHRNRYGANAAIPITQLWTDRIDDHKKVEKALKWLLFHGGNVDVADGDGWTARRMIGMVSGKLQGTLLGKILDAEDNRRLSLKGKCCTLCARNDAEKLLQCSRCKNARYCTFDQPSQKRNCQKLDWPRHKKECRA